MTARKMKWHAARSSCNLLTNSLEAFPDRQAWVKRHALLFPDRARCLSESQEYNHFVCCFGQYLSLLSAHAN